MNFAWAKPAMVAAAALTLGVGGCNRGGDGADPAGDETAIRAAQDFLIKNGREEGVVTTPTGLQYRIVESGPATGGSADSNDLVRVHYEGTLVDGTVFDSSFERGAPVVFSPEQVVKGWTEALQMMRPGDEWLLYVPPALGYGDRAAGPIPANSVLVFRLKVLDVAPVPGGIRGVGQANG